MIPPKAIAFFLLFSCLACGHANREKKTHVVNDTTILLTKACSMGADESYMPGAGSLGDRRKDSVYLTSRSIPLEYLRDNDSLEGFNIVSPDSVCSLIRKDSNSRRQNYLCVNQIQKSDTGYYVQMASLGCENYAGGGTLGLYFKKSGDSLILVKQGAASIN